MVPYTAGDPTSGATAPGTASIWNSAYSAPPAAIQGARAATVTSVTGGRRRYSAAAVAARAAKRPRRYGVGGSANPVGSTHTGRVAAAAVESVAIAALAGGSRTQPISSDPPNPVA